jgi:hypothetical protein
MLLLLHGCKALALLMLQLFHSGPELTQLL